MGTFGKPWTIDQLTEALKRQQNCVVRCPDTWEKEKRDTANPEAKLGHSSVNRKIKNARKVTDEKGRTFDSKLEHYFASQLDKHNIPYEWQRKFVLQEKFRYRSEAVREMTLTIDFFLPTFDMLVDTKGFFNDTAPIKHKLLKRKLLTEGKPYEIRLPKNRKECDALVVELLTRTTQSAVS